MEKSTLFRKVASRLGGYDIFISYRQADAQQYAEALHKILESKGFIVFRDESEADNLGTSVEDFAKLACSARCLVTILTPDIYKSRSVSEELSSYLSNRIDKWYRRPFSRIISIDVESSLSKAYQQATCWQRLSNFVYEAESLDRVRNAAPSRHVVDRLTAASTFMNAWRRFLLLTGVVIVAALTAIAATSLYLNTLIANISNTEKELQLISDSTSRLSNINKRLVGSNSKLQQQSTALVSLSNKLRKDSTTLATTNQELNHQSNALRKQADSLDARGVMLNFRISAMNLLETDPVKAYRLAEQAYLMDKSSENSALIRLAASSIDYYYNSVLDNYQIIDFKEPYILLKKEDAKNHEPNLAVYDMRTRDIKLTTIHGDHAWVISDETSWRILTRNWVGDGSDAIPEYHLWNNRFVSLGDKIQESRLSVAQFLSPNKVSIRLYRQHRTLLWDLLSNTKEYIDQDTTDQTGGDYFRDIYGALATRADGKSAAHHDNGLILVDVNGKIDPSTYTEVDFDPSSFFSRAEWSPDDKYLALNYFDRKRLGIWNPRNKGFLWLDPDGWVVNAFSWSQQGHLLAFSGRTENDVDVTIELVDASAPETSRAILHRGNVPIQSIAFLPGDEKLVICDKESNMFIIEIASKSILGKGQQADIVKSSILGFYSSGNSGFKNWSTSPAPAKNWSFKSRRERTYVPQAAAHPSNKWFAVPFIHKSDTLGAIELRNILTGQREDLAFPREYVHAIDFSHDGNWLILLTSKQIHFWQTNSWQRFDFPLLEGDRQFIGLRLKTDTIYASLAEDSADYVIDYVFVINKSLPRFIDRTPSRIKSEERYSSRSAIDHVADLTRGWRLEPLYKYRAMGWMRSRRWGIRLACRDNPLGAQDCDVFFIPIDVSWLMQEYDKLLWKPTNQEISKLVKGEKASE